MITKVLPGLRFNYIFIVAKFNHSRVLNARGGETRISRAEVRAVIDRATAAFIFL